MKQLMPILLFVVALANTSCAQEADNSKFRVAFYNVENLFDTDDDANVKDEEFTPTSKKEWTGERYQKKLDDIAQVLHSIDTIDYPEIIGLCEVENRGVVQDLIDKTKLKDNGYKVVHEDSPDARGIDVALIYEASRFSYESHQTFAVKLPGDRPDTRDILYVKGKADNKEDLHIFVNHWPSRWGGTEQSSPKRELVAAKLRHVVDSIQQTDAKAKIVIVGDLNDHPINKSVFEVLNARHNKKPAVDGELYNLMYAYHEKGEGTHNYKGEWGVLDHVIVSFPLLKDKKGLHTSTTGAAIHKQDFMLFTKKDGTQIPNRTYGGSNYYGGFSDHLPVVCTFEW